MEQPVLRLGMLGFSAAQADRLVMWMRHVQPGWPEWQAFDPHLADAWMIAGDSVDVLGRDAVVIRHPYGSDTRLTLNRTEVDRPLAFASPLPEGFASAEFFDADDELSVRQRLQRFEAWLRPLRTQFALGALLVERVDQLRRGVVHLTHDGKLLAVLDLDQWRVGLHIPARPVDLAAADWVRRPSLANDIPSSFIRLPLHRVMWTYAVRTRQDVLPSRYRQMPVYLRRVPRMPARWFDDLHLLIMRELTVRPATLAELGERTQATAADLAHHLAALYYAGAVTTDAESARRAEVRVRKDLGALQLDQAVPDTVAVSRTMEYSQLGVPTSTLREAQHSPLRTADRHADLTAPMPLREEDG
ncbi:MAG: hypothetical protein MUF55_05690 [Hydrogenophaga sp.]|nr:hypothetical protein [Hydrogenophaga sp.]